MRLVGTLIHLRKIAPELTRKSTPNLIHFSCESLPFSVERNLNIEANAVVSEYIRLHTLFQAVRHMSEGRTVR